MSESDERVAPCLALLESLRRAGKPIVATRTNSGKVQTIHGRWIELCDAGWPDITATIAGKSVHIECKELKGKQRDTQIKMQAKQEAAGGVYLLVKELRVLRDYLKREGLL